MTTSPTIAIVGAGLIGQSWANCFARAGSEVRLFDPVDGQAEAAREGVERGLADMKSNGLLDQDVADCLARVSVADSLPAAVEGAAYIQESAPEVLEAKREVTAAICQVAGPDAVVASSTSGFVPSLFSEDVKGRERCIVAHPINPPYLLPAVELVPAPWTSPETIERARTLLAAVEQVPVVMKKEIGGFILNRLQGALLHEAFRLVAGGYISAGDLDQALVGGLAPRWAVIGPFETIDLNAPGGIRDYVERYAGLYLEIAKDQTEPCDWSKALDDGIEAERTAALPRADLKQRQAWRDQRLTELAAFRRNAVPGETD